MIFFATAKDIIYDLIGRAELVKRRHLQIPNVINGKNSLVSVFSEERLNNFARLAFVFSEVIFFARLFRPFVASQRLFAPGHMTDKVKGVHVPANFGG